MSTDIEIAQAREDGAHRQARGGEARHRRRASRTLWALQGEGLPRLYRHAARSAGRQAHSRHRDQPDAGRRRQDDDHRRPRRRAEPHRQEGLDLPARAFARAGVRHEGRRGRRRPRAGRSDGGHQPAFYRRLQRHRARNQPARRDDRQPHPSRQRAEDRRAPDHLEARRRHERPRAARHRHRAGRNGQRLSAPGRLRHRRRLGGHGDLLSGHLDRGLEAAARQHRRRLHHRAEAGACARPQGAWRHGACCSRTR